MQRWWVDLEASMAAERGATMMEYGIVVALIALVSILVVTAVGLDVFGQFDMAQSSFDGPGPTPATP